MTRWTSRSAGNSSLPPVQVDESLLDELVIILLQGRNSFNDPVYAYLELTFRNFRVVKQKLQAGEEFTPSDFGRVIAAGTGVPSEEIRAEMAANYNMMDIPKPITRITAPAPKADIFSEETDDNSGGAPVTGDQPSPNWS